MKNIFNIAKQILFICLMSTASSTASNTPNVLEALVLGIECPVSFTESASPICEFILPDYTSLATLTGASGTPTITQSPVPSSIEEGWLLTLINRKEDIKS